jgi:hypothetical protein
MQQPDEIAQPTFRDTIIFRVPIWAYHKSIGRFFNKSSPHGNGDSPTILTPPGSDEEGDEAAVLKSAVTGTANAEAKKRKGRPIPK